MKNRQVTVTSASVFFAMKMLNTPANATSATPLSPGTGVNGSMLVTSIWPSIAFQKYWG